MVKTGAGKPFRARICLLWFVDSYPIVWLMKAYILMFAMIIPSVCAADEALRAGLEKSYKIWRDAMIRKDARTWELITAEHRRVEVRNRIVSEKLPYPAAIFEVPAPPPALEGLTFLRASKNGRTAKAAYFGKVDFGVGGEPTDNLLVLSFVDARGRMMYDRADFVNLTALADVRKELAGGDLSYLDGVPEAKPSGVVPNTPIAVNPATTIAKVYVFCPGREVEVQVNKVSRHRFANAKEAETVLGGGRDGVNEVQYSIKPLEGGTGKEALTIRVYLLSEVPDTKPVKVFEYQIAEDEAPKPYGSGTFVLDAAVKKKLGGG
jgi:hypothetical protein